jgi:hypothetical protein
MEWYWFALIGGVIAPWFVMGSSIRIGFEEGGITTALGVWSGACVITVPFMFLIIWIAKLVFG